MKKTIISSILVTCLFSSNAFSINQAVSLSYAQGKIDNTSLNTLRGFVAQYRYELDTDLSLLGSFTYLSNHEDFKFQDFDEFYNGYIDTKYYSLLVGPAYRFNEYISLYSLGGVSYTKYEQKARYYSLFEAGMGISSADSSSPGIAWGAGLTVNPTDQIAINIGYEGSRVKLLGDKYTLNSFNIGFGYRF